MSLILIGHKVSGEAASVQAGKLIDGLGFHYLDTSTRRETFASGTSSLNVLFSDLQGNAADAHVLKRTASSWNSTTPTSKNNLAFVTYNNSSDVWEVGTSGDNVEVYGQSISNRLIDLLLSDQYPSQSRFIEDPAATGVRVTGITSFPFTENISLDYNMGASTGFWPLKSKFRLGFTANSALSADEYWDYCIRIQKWAVISNAGFVSNNSV